MNGGWLKLYRQAVHTPELRDDVAALGFWCWMLAQAAHKPAVVYRGKGGRRVDLGPGQLVVAASSVPGLTRKRASSLLERFSEAGMIRVETRRDTGHTITIVKWLDYQANTPPAEDARGIQGTNKGHTRDKQGTTAQEEQESKNIDSDSSLRSESCQNRELTLADDGSAVAETDAPTKAVATVDQVAEAVRAYNAMAEQIGLPIARKVTEARRAKLRARLRDCGGLSGWVEALRKLAASSHCSGGNNRGWRADLDFLLQETSFVRLMEGRYDDRRPSRQQGSFAADMADLISQARDYDNAAVHDGTRDDLCREDPVQRDRLPTAGGSGESAGGSEGGRIVELFAARR